MEEQSIELKQKSKLSNSNNTKREQNTKKQNLTSLPDLLDIKTAQRNEENLSRSNQFFNDQTHSFSTLKYQDVIQLSQEILNAKVNSFLGGILSDEDKCRVLLQNFKFFQKDAKIEVRKSKKVIQDTKNIIQLTDLKELPKKQGKKQGKQRRKVRFTDLIQEEEHQKFGNISIKIVCSNAKLNENEQNSTKEMALSLGKFFSFNEMGVEYQKSKSLGSQIKDMIVEDYSNKSKGSKDQSSGASLGKIQHLCKNPSIIMFEDEEDEKQSEIFSSKGSLVSFQSIQKPIVPFDLELVKKIFWNCSPFLVNLSLCLMIKGLTKHKVEIKEENISWLLVTATIVAYKIFYDEEIEGLTSHYAKMLKMKNEDLVSLEIWFLHQLNYEIYVSNRQYFEIMSQLLKLKVRS